MGPCISAMTETLIEDDLLGRMSLDFLAGVIATHRNLSIPVPVELTTEAINRGIILTKEF